jgi:phage/plasmid-associated DNA primase
MIDLSHNRYCPLCKREHDEPQNCLKAGTGKLTLLCRKDRLRNSISLPLANHHGNVIFAVNNVNVTVASSEAGMGDVRDFGGYERFPKVYENENLNSLCFQSLSGMTCDLAAYGIELLRGQYVFQDNTWYWFTGKYWKSGVGPDELLSSEIREVYVRLESAYNKDKQLRWLYYVRERLGDLSRRKSIIEDMERMIFKHWDRVPLDEDRNLIGFENGVFDARDGGFREHRSSDYLTKLLKYSVPAEVDCNIRTQMEKAVEDILPIKSVRNFVLLTSALHLEGINRHNLAMVWTGTGGNGKVVLKKLMSLALGEMHHEPPAAFLTSAPPSAGKPAPELVILRHARSVFCSEPEYSKLANGRFVKYLTGQDVIEARMVHAKKLHRYVPRFLLTLMSNKTPLFEGSETEVQDLWRRLKIVDFEKNSDEPRESHERERDLWVEERVREWGPQFMLWLMEIFRDYISRGRTLQVPAEVERTPDDQKDESDPFPNWFREHFRAKTGSRVHIHRIAERYNDHVAKRAYTATSLKSRLTSMKLDTSTNSERARGCPCGNANKCLLGYEEIANAP